MVAEYKADSIIAIDIPFHDFFRYWMDFTHPLHRLTPSEMNVVSAFIEKYYELSKVVFNEDILSRILFGKEIKDEITGALDIKQNNFLMIMRNLAKKGVIEGGKINKRFIPDVKREKGEFRILIRFKFTDGKDGTYIQGDSKENRDS